MSANWTKLFMLSNRPLWHGIRLWKMLYFNLVLLIQKQTHLCLFILMIALYATSPDLCVPLLTNLAGNFSLKDTGALHYFLVVNKYIHDFCIIQIWMVLKKFLLLFPQAYLSSSMMVLLPLIALNTKGFWEVFHTSPSPDQTSLSLWISCPNSCTNHLKPTGQQLRGCCAT